MALKGDYVDFENNSNYVKLLQLKKSSLQKEIALCREDKECEVDSNDDSENEKEIEKKTEEKRNNSQQFHDFIKSKSKLSKFRNSVCGMVIDQRNSRIFTQNNVIDGDDKTYEEKEFIFNSLQSSFIINNIPINCIGEVIIGFKKREILENEKICVQGKEGNELFIVADGEFECFIEKSKTLITSKNEKMNGIRDSKLSNQEKEFEIGNINSLLEVNLSMRIIFILLF